MAESNYNSRHADFRKRLRKYHDYINSTNRYSLQKIAGKLNVFESDSDDELRPKERHYRVERRIPNTGLTVLKREDDFYAIGDSDGNQLTEFKYQFIEGCLGDHDKVVRCVTDDGNIEDFSVETQRIVEDGGGGCAGGCAGGCSCGDGGGSGMSGIGTTDVGLGGGGHGDYSEIDYSTVRKQLEIPYLCGARVVDVAKRRKKRRRRGRRG